jgi:hypothetical protein
MLRLKRAECFERCFENKRFVEFFSVDFVVVVVAAFNLLPRKWFQERKQ